MIVSININQYKMSSKASKTVAPSDKDDQLNITDHKTLVLMLDSLEEDVLRKALAKLLQYAEQSIALSCRLFEH